MMKEICLTREDTRTFQRPKNAKWVTKKQMKFSVNKYKVMHTEVKN